MYKIDMDNRFYRVFSITVDDYGIDPYLDKIVPKLQDIIAFTRHEVTQDERGAPDLISFREYESEEYWWHIMAYNGICRFRSIVEGMTIKIPDIGALIAITNDTVTDVPPATSRVVVF
jgi:hypothetical protein